MTRDEIGDKDTDNTVENAEELGGGYGGPFPADPEKEGAADADTDVEGDGDTDAAGDADEPSSN